MKKIILVAVLALFFGCQKENNENIITLKSECKESNFVTIWGKQNKSDKFRYRKNVYNTKFDTSFVVNIGDTVYINAHHVNKTKTSSTIVYNGVIVEYLDGITNLGNSGVWFIVR